MIEWGQYFTEVYTILTVTICTFLWKELMRERRKNVFLQEGMVALLRDKMLQLHVKFMAQGYCLPHELENFRGLYAAYHNLGGNGTMTALLAEIEALPHAEEG